MKILDLVTEGCFLFESNYFKDQRGAFLKVFDRSNSLFPDYEVKQINYVVSAEKYTVRGLHYQAGISAESKIFRVISGSAQIVFVDARTDANTYLHTYSVVLKNPEQAIIIPRGYATGYCTLEENTIMLYLSDNDYNVTAECGLLWNDPKLNIQWLGKEPVLSEKDKSWTLLSD